MSVDRRGFLVAVAATFGAALQDSLAGSGPAGRVADPASAGRPMTPLTAADIDAAYQVIEKQLKCTCGCGLDIYTCRTTDFNCTYSPGLHREVVALSEQGKTAQQIIDEFVAKYGQQALMAPPKRGFNLLGYLVPSFVVLVAAGFLIRALQRWTRGGGGPKGPPAPPPARAGGAYAPHHAPPARPPPPRPPRRRPGPVPWTLLPPRSRRCAASSSGSPADRAMLELIAGILLATGATYFVLRPILRPEPERDIALGDEGDDPNDDLSPQAVALRALKEIEFDRATGKLSDADYDELHAKYQGEALAALRGDQPRLTPEPRAVARGQSTPKPACPVDGPRPEGDAVFCSACGRRLGTAPAYCARCGSALESEARYCNRCGSRVAA